MEEAATELTDATELCITLALERAMELKLTASLELASLLLVGLSPPPHADKALTTNPRASGLSIA